jgi:preprotein translocase subunit YajC
MSIVSLIFLAQPGAPAPAPPSLLDTMIPILAIMVIMWVLMIRPQQKKQRELAAKIAGLKTGDRVVTVGGVHGVVTNVKDGPTLTLKVDDNCKLTVDKASVALILNKDA